MDISCWVFRVMWFVCPYHPSDYCFVPRGFAFQTSNNSSLSTRALVKLLQTMQRRRSLLENDVLYASLQVLIGRPVRDLFRYRASDQFPC